MSKRLPHLSEPSKMECRTFDLDIDKSGCVNHCQYGLNNICYVVNNQYRENSPSRIAKKDRNWELANSKDFVRILTSEIRLTKQRIFRFFQSGDFFSLEFFKKVMQVCANLPKVDFWIPTTKDQYLNEYLLNGGTIPKNTTIRLSAPKPNIPFHKGIIEFYSKWKNVTFSETTTDPKLATCKASIENSTCGDCEDCFKPNHAKTVYLLHGSKAMKNFKNMKVQELR
jgi:hypothetical protein